MRTEQLQGHEMGASSTGKSKLANNLTSWWSKYKNKLSEEQLNQLYNRFNFRPGQKMTIELKNQIIEFIRRQ
jgi:hypothetical protein